jgi:hypothetical protein
MVNCRLPCPFSSLERSEFSLPLAIANSPQVCKSIFLASGGINEAVNVQNWAVVRDMAGVPDTE